MIRIHGVLSCIVAWVAAATATAGFLSAEIGIGWTNGWVREWRKDVPGLEVRDSSVKVRDGLTKVVRRWTWTGKVPLEKVTLSVRYRMDGAPAALKPFIPGVLLYGNPSNKGRKDGKVPVYAGEDGEFAIFEEHRIPMPFVLLENVRGGDFAAIHTLPSPVRGAVRGDLWWSAGVEARRDGADIVLLSGPIGYNRRRSVAKARQFTWMDYDNAYITLRPGQVVEKTFWIQSGKATKDAFGFEQAMDASLELFRPYDAERFASIGEIARMKRTYAMTRWIDENGACGFNMFDAATGRREIVLGWCGCGATCGYALPVLDFAAGDWEKAQKSLDFISDRLGPTVRPQVGIFKTNINLNDGKLRGGDPVSCGQSLYSVLKAIRFAEKNGGARLDASKWRAFAEKVADDMAAGLLKKDWYAPRTTGEAFLIAPLVMASEIFNKPDCLAAAKRLADFFERNYFGYDRVYWGGSLDARCEDKEGAMAVFQGCVALLRHAVNMNGRDARSTSEDERRYVRLARHAMNMMLTYTMVWDASYPPGRLSDHAFKSTGWSVVSPQNQCLDAFGVLATPDIWWMGEYLKDERLKRLSLVMYRSCYQLTSPDGSLGEQILQTNYRHMGDMHDLSTFRGDYSEHWTVFWLTAHFLGAAAEFKEMGVEVIGGQK